MLHTLDKIKPQLDDLEEKEWLLVRQAFLYEVASKVDHLDITIDKNRRGITVPVVKSFIKHVYLKHELQGVNFRAWDSDDFEGLKLNHFPQALKTEIESRRLSIVETPRYWFLVAPVRTLDINRYSICRFLTEDTEYGLYITYGCYIPRHHVSDALIETILVLIGTIYTLEVSASATLLSFMEDSKKAFLLELQPLLRQPLDFNGDLEEAVSKRLSVFQKKLDSLILARMPIIMKAIAHNPDDRAIFIHYVSTLFNNIWQDIELFNLLPATEYVDATQILSSRLMCYRIFLKKSQDFYWNHDLDWDLKVKEVLSPHNTITKLFDDIRHEQEQIIALHHQLHAYEESVNQGKFLAKLGFGRPKYTKEDLDEHARSLSEDFFLQIIRMAKTQRQFMVYYEFESMKTGLNETDHRHYSVPTGKTGLDKLPLLARLPQNRHSFDVSSFKLI